jgi:hypothetical protein
VSIAKILLNVAELEQRLQYNSEVLKKGASGNLPQINFRPQAPKIAEHIALQAQT